MKLNVELSATLATAGLGGVDDSTVIFAGIDPLVDPDSCDIAGLSAGGFISIADLIADADAELDAEGAVPAGMEPERTCQEFKKDALDAANNNEVVLALDECLPVVYSQQ